MSEIYFYPLLAHRAMPRNTEITRRDNRLILIITRYKTRVFEKREKKTPTIVSD